MHAAAAAGESDDPCDGEARLLATLNRPTVGYSVCAVPVGSVFSETGYQNTTNSGGASGHQTQYPQGFIRFGIARRFEIDAIVPNRMQTSQDGGHTSGFTDAGIAVKNEFLPRTRFTYAVDGIVTLPTGSSGFTSGAPTYALNADIAYAVSPNVGAATTIAFASLSGFDAVGNRARYTSLQPSFVITDQFARFTQAYAEIVFGSRPAPDVPARTFIDYGVQRLLSKRLEIDVEFGSSLNDVRGGAFHYIGAGFGLQL